MNNTCSPRITATAGTKLAGTFLLVLSFSSQNIEFYSQRALITHVVQLDQALAHCPISPTAGFIKKPGPCLSSSVADHPLRPARHRRHGRPLPHHQANVPQAHLSANAGASFLITYLCGISQDFSWLSPTKRQITYVLLTRAPLYSHPKVLSRSTCMYQACHQRSF